ncbi:hypothetical protein ACFLQK_01330 [bacterium]
MDNRDKTNGRTLGYLTAAAVAFNAAVNACAGEIGKAHEKGERERAMPRAGATDTEVLVSVPTKEESVERKARSLRTLHAVVSLV